MTLNKNKVSSVLHQNRKVPLYLLDKGPSSRVKLNHPATNILGSLNDNMRLRSKALNVITHSCYLSQCELKKVDETL